MKTILALLFLAAISLTGCGSSSQPSAPVEQKQPDKQKDDKDKKDKGEKEQPNKKERK